MLSYINKKLQLFLLSHSKALAKKCLFKSNFVTGFGSGSQRLENNNQVESLFLHAAVDISSCFGWERGNYLLHIWVYDRKQWVLKVSLWRMWKNFGKLFAHCECLSSSVFLQAAMKAKENLKTSLKKKDTIHRFQIVIWLFLLQRKMLLRLARYFDSIVLIF